MANSREPDYAFETSDSYYALRLPEGFDRPSSWVMRMGPNAAAKFTASIASTTPPGETRQLLARAVAQDLALAREYAEANTDEVTVVEDSSATLEINGRIFSTSRFAVRFDGDIPEMVLSQVSATSLGGGGNYETLALLDLTTGSGSALDSWDLRTSLETLSMVRLRGSARESEARHWFRQFGLCLPAQLGGPRVTERRTIEEGELTSASVDDPRRLGASLVLSAPADHETAKRWLEDVSSLESRGRTVRRIDDTELSAEATRLGLTRVLDVGPVPPRYDDEPAEPGFHEYRALVDVGGGLHVTLSLAAADLVSHHLPAMWSELVASFEH